MLSICVATVSRDHIGFTHHEMFVKQNLSNDTAFYSPSVETEPGDSNLPKWQNCFLITNTVQLVSQLSMPFCTFFMCSILFPCHFSLLYMLVIMTCMDWMDCYWHGKNFMLIIPLEICLLRKLGTYFTRCKCPLLSVQLHFRSWSHGSVFCSICWAWMLNYGETLFSHIQNFALEHGASFKLFSEL